MALEHSFNYLFFDLNKQIKTYQIHYVYDVFCKKHDGPSPELYDPYFDLTVNRFNGHLFHDRFKESFKETLDTTIKEISSHIQEIYPSLPVFVERIDKEVEIAKILSDVFSHQKILVDNIISEKVKFDFGGKLPLYLAFGTQYHMLFGNEKPAEPERSEDDFLFVLDTAKKFFQTIVEGLERLKLFMLFRIEMNEFNSREIEKGKKSVEKSQLYGYISKAEIGPAFEKLSEIPKMANSQRLMLISSRYYKLEQQKQNGTISQADYKEEYARIVEALIGLINEV